MAAAADPAPETGAPVRYDLATAAHDYPPRDGPPQRSILICTHPRSGSTLLGEALYFAGGLGCPLEYLHAGFRPAFAERWDAPDLTSLAAAARRHRTDHTGTLSIKLFWRDIQDVAQEADPALARALSLAPAEVPDAAYDAAAALVTAMFPNPVIIHLRREDRLRQAISAMVAVDTGRWRAIPGQTHAATGPMPALDAERIERLMGYGDFCHGHFARLFAAMGATPHAVLYEELTADYIATLTALLRHLGSDAAPPAARMQRQSDGNSEALVLAYLRSRGTLVTAGAQTGSSAGQTTA